MKAGLRKAQLFSTDQSRIPKGIPQSAFKGETMLLLHPHIPAPNIHPEKALIQRRIASHRKWRRRRTRLRLLACFLGRKAARAPVFFSSKILKYRRRHAVPRRV